MFAKEKKQHNFQTIKYFMKVGLLYNGVVYFLTEHGVSELPPIWRLAIKCLQKMNIKELIIT